MTIKQKDIKILWGRSGNRCAVCRQPLTLDSEVASSESYPLGEQAHIVGEKPDSPRGKSILTPEERNSYANLILLCPNDHSKIDRAVADFPVEKLHHIKTQHELWVESTLAREADPTEEAEKRTVSHLVDSAVEACNFENWENWTSHALSTHPRWLKEAPTKIEDFCRQMIAGIWPKSASELERSMLTLAHTMHWSVKVFMRYSVEWEDCYFGPMFFKHAEGGSEYESALKRWEEWIDNCHFLIRESTKAANWVADVVRRDINPMFFATTGKFMVTYGSDVNLSFKTVLLEYSDEERKGLPDAFFAKVEESNEFGMRFEIPA